MFPTRSRGPQSQARRAPQPSCGSAGRGIAGARIYSVGEATHPLPRLVNEKDDVVYGPTDERGRLRIGETKWLSADLPPR